MNNEFIKFDDYIESKNLFNKLILTRSLSENELKHVVDLIFTKYDKKIINLHPFIMIINNIDTLNDYYFLSKLNDFTYISDFKNSVDIPFTDIEKFIDKNNIKLCPNNIVSHFEIIECAICLDEINRTDKNNCNNITTLDCLHYYHTHCINEWIKKTPNCPLCKIPILNDIINKWFDLEYEKWINNLIKFKSTSKMCITM